MIYSKAIEYMYSKLPMFSRIGATAYKKDLSRTLALCKHLGDPQKEIKFIHVAGTNGKGSVSHIMAAVLQSHGYMTGLYVSPHYRDFRERIKINGTYISKKYVSSFIDKHREIIESIEPSFFELTVAMALQYFKEMKVDYTIIETGLGGRLDSTNIILPLMSIITNISWDHMDILGESLEKIATEKAGIIKPGIPVVIGRKQHEIESVFLEKADQLKSPIYFVNSKINSSQDGNKFEINNEISFFPDLKGPYQKENYNTAYTACRILIENKIVPLSIDKIKFAFENVSMLTAIIGRWQWMKKDRRVLIDSAHNEDGIKYLCDWIKLNVKKNLHIVCGFVKDKKLDQVLSLFPTDASYYFVQAKIPRALDSHELKLQAKNFNLNGKNYKTSSAGLSAARKKSGADDLIVVCGSIFVIAEII
ncbi:MAG: folylpolyglutamate synthase/dihydrofolate synthase family protein [Saprospiraceae bacterium]